MEKKVLIKGAGDLATGVAWALHKQGYKVLMTEIEKPLTVRRQVAFSQAVYQKKVVVEGVTARLVQDYREACDVWKQDEIPVIVDEKAEIIQEYLPDILIDAIVAKTNKGTTIQDAPIVLALGPGFSAGKDCHAVLETMRGPTLGQPIYEGQAIPNTGVPGMVGGYAIERLIQAASDGIMVQKVKIGEKVKKGQILAVTGDAGVRAQIDGIIRGLLQEGLYVRKGMKIGDVDPRNDESLVYRISDKSWKIAEGVNQAIAQLDVSSCGIVLLAAGRSKRYGSNKLLADNNGKKMYERAYELLKQQSGTPAVVVTRFPELIDQAERQGIQVAVNEHPEKGISHSVKLGVDKLLETTPGIKGILFMVCDQPELSAESVEKILKTFEGNEDQILCAASDGKLGNPVLFGRNYFEELRNLSGDVGGKRVMKHHPEQVITVDVEARELEDVDFPCIE